nr:DUF1707 domain-containing protein [Streptomyces sp. SA15]
MSIGVSPEPGLRASHADRDRVVDVLRIAAGDGRLTAEELDERLEGALSARTMGELAALTVDLPSVADGGAVEAKDVVRIEQKGASARRGEGWVVPRRMEIHSDWGEVTLDFTEAVITYDTLRIDLDMRGGALMLVTRPGVVVDTDALVTNYAKIKTRRAALSDAPVVLRVEVTGELSFGQVLVRPPRRGFGRRAVRG